MIVLLFLVSCQKSYDSFDQSTATNPQIGTVSLDVATNIATNFFKMYYENVDNKPIDNQLTVDENGVPYFYLFNYKNGGFLIVSAEYGDMPILANDVSSIFPTKGEKINAGLGIWMMETRDRIKAIREGKIQSSEMATALWKDLKAGTYKAKFKTITIDDIRRNANKAQSRDEDGTWEQNCGRPYTNTQKGPFMTTQWGQGCYYNTFVTDNFGGPCGRAVTGCVATSLAQIRKFHMFPSSPSAEWKYHIMPNEAIANDIGSYEIAWLMSVCGNAVNTNYGAASSSAPGENMEGALQSWGYSNDATYSHHNTGTIEANIDAGNPVILTGCHIGNTNCFLWWCWGADKCHAWVSDGYQKSTHPCYGYQYALWMNWGWDGTGNGFYGDFVPRDIAEYRNYQYERKMLHNIHP